MPQLRGNEPILGLNNKNNSWNQPRKSIFKLVALLRFWKDCKDVQEYYNDYHFPCQKKSECPG
jgi:hypothetical protein